MVPNKLDRRVCLCILVASVALYLAGRRSSGSRQAALLGLMSGILFGTSACLVKPTVETLHLGVSDVLSSWEFYAMAITGIVAFVGLIVPHAARRLVGPAHGVLLPASTLLGGILVLVVDCIARSAVPPNELPLGVLTSLLGVPFFLVILRRRREPDV